MLLLFRSIVAVISFHAQNLRLKSDVHGKEELFSDKTFEWFIRTGQDCRRAYHSNQVLSGESLGIYWIILITDCWKLHNTQQLGILMKCERLFCGKAIDCTVISDDESISVSEVATASESQRPLAVITSEVNRATRTESLIHVRRGVAGSFL